MRYSCASRSIMQTLGNTTTDEPSGAGGYHLRTSRIMASIWGSEVLSAIDGIISFFTTWFVSARARSWTSGYYGQNECENGGCSLESIKWERSINGMWWRSKCNRLNWTWMIRAISRNEDELTDALRFDPSRHLTTDGQLKDRITSNHFAFGRGRCVARIFCCLFRLPTRAGVFVLVCWLSISRNWADDDLHTILKGRWLAEDAMWVAITTMLSVLHFDYARDTNGKRIEIVPESTPGIQTYVYDNSHARNVGWLSSAKVPGTFPVPI